MVKLNSVNLKVKLEEDSKLVNLENGLTVRFFPVGYPNRKPSEQYGKIKSYFRDESESRLEFNNKVDIDTFVDALNNGYVHMLTDIRRKKTLTKEVAKTEGVFRSNVMCFDIDCKYKEDGTPKQPKVLEAVNKLGGIFKFEEELLKHFHILQRSCSWNVKDVFSPSYHGYIFLAEEINNIEDYQVAYKFVVKKLSEALNIEFDPTIDPLKMICAGKVGYGNLVENKNKPKLILPQDLYINKKEADIKKAHKNTKVTKINKDELRGNLLNNQQAVLDDYDAWWRVLAGLINAEIEGLLSEEDVLEIAEAIDDGNGEYIRLLDYYRTNPMSDISLGTVLHHLNRLGIETSNIISSSYEKSILDTLNNVTRIPFSNKISMNKNVMEVIDNALSSKGQRILLYAPTNAGKTTAFIQLIHERHGKSKGFKAIVTTRKKLRENLSVGFVKGEACLSVDGTQLQDGEVTESQVLNSYNFVTTYDNAPKLFSMISHKLDSDSDNILIVDEAHMLASDTGFKADRVKNFLDFEYATISDPNTNMVSIHTTATIDDMDLTTYDRIIILEDQEPKLPFNEIEYKQFPQGVNKVDTFYKELKLHNGRLLVFVENKDIIKSYAKQLREEGKNVVTITSESNMSEDAFNDQETLDRVSIIKKGIVPSYVDIILATSTIGAGVSIVDTSIDWETWILITQESPNGNPTSIRQYANRLRNKFSKLVLFVPFIRETSSSNEYLLHKKVGEHLLEANIMVTKYGQKYENTRYFKLSEGEARNGLHRTSKGTVVFKEKVYSFHLGERTKHNINNPLCLINALSRHYGVKLNKGGFVLGLTEEEKAQALRMQEHNKEEAEAFLNEFLADEERVIDLVTKKDKSEYFNLFLQDVSIINRKKVKAVKSLIFTSLDAKDFVEAYPRVLKSKYNFNEDLRTYRMLDDGSYKTLNEVISKIMLSPWVKEELTKADLEAKIEEVIDSLELGTTTLKPLTVKNVRKFFAEEVKQKKIQGKNSKRFKLNRPIDRHTLIERYGFDPTYGFGDIRVIEFVEQDIEESPFI